MKARRVAFAVTILFPLLACDGPRSTEPPSVQMRPTSASLSAAGAPTVGPPASIVFYSARGGSQKIYVMNPDGTGQQQVTDGSGNDVWPDLSPDGRFVTFASNRSGHNEIYVLDLSDGTLVNVSNQSGDNNWPRWSPNGHRIAFHSNHDGNYNILTVNPDGTDLSRVTSNAALDEFPDWSPNGKQIAFRRGTNVYVADADAEEQNVQQLTFLPPAFLNQMPVWSPNGKQIAFMSTRDGYPSVFLMSADGDTPDHPAVNLTPKDPADPNSAWVSRAPAWSKNGRQIYFMSLRPSTGGDVEIFVMNADGTGVTRVTQSPGEDGGPQSR
jgi:Tol biopolymer transport system component